MSGELKPLLDWRARYESTDPLQTNYLQAGEFDVITTDTGKESVKLDSEGNLKEQSAAEIIRAVEDVVFKKSFDNVVCYTDYHSFTYQRERLIPDLDAPKNKETIVYLDKRRRFEHERICFGEEYESKLFGQKMKSVTRLGTVTFSDSDLDPRHPRGSVIRFGPGQFGAPVVRRTPKKLSGRYLTPPEIKRFDPCERLIKMEDGVASNDNLDPKYASVLDVAITSKNFEAIGSHFGFTGKTAERRGKRLTLEACKAFSEVSERLAA